MRFHPGLILLGILGVALTSLFGVLVSREIQPRRLEWEAVSPSNVPRVGQKLVISAVTRRVESEGCANGFQVDMRRDGKEIRLPAPERTLNGEGVAIYEIVLPDDVQPGAYSARLRETFNCKGRLQIIEAPWIRFEVVE